MITAIVTAVIIIALFTVFAIGRKQGNRRVPIGYNPVAYAIFYAARLPIRVLRGIVSGGSNRRWD